MNPRSKERKEGRDEEAKGEKCKDSKTDVCG